MKRVSFFIMCFLLLSSFLSAQELNCRVQVNSDKIQGTNKQVFTTLEQAISEYINNRKWSNAQISNNERIECTFLLTVNEVEDNVRFIMRPILRQCLISGIRNLNLIIKNMNLWYIMKIP